MSSRFDYVQYDAEAAKKQQKIKDAFKLVEAEVILSLRDCRATSLALTRLEEAYMWAGKAIRDEQIERGGPAADEPHRTNE